MANLDFQLWTTAATLATALAALFTVLEMRWQRHSGYRPDLMVSGSSFDLVETRAHTFLPADALDSFDGSDEIEHWDWISLPCTNVGVGYAKNVTYEWAYDVVAFAESIAALDASMAKGIQSDGNLLSIEAPISSMHVLAPQSKGMIPYVAPGQVAEGKGIRPPPGYVMLLSCYLSALVNSSSGRGSEIPPEPERLSLLLRYHDIGGNEHRKRLTLRPVVMMWSTHVPTGEGIGGHQVRGYFEVQSP